MSIISSFLEVVPMECCRLASVFRVLVCYCEQNAQHVEHSIDLEVSVSTRR